MQHTVIAFGELLWDLLPDRTVLGGAPFNFAFRINELGDRGIPVSRLGRDPYGTRAAAQVASLGVDTSFLQEDDRHPTGTVPVRFITPSRPDYLIVPEVAYDFIEMTAGLEKLCGSAHCICFGTLIQRSATSRETLRKVLGAGPQAIKFLDINLRKLCYTPETIRFSLEAADILKLNEQEIDEVRGILNWQEVPMAAAAQRLLEEWRLRAVLVTLGEHGSFAVASDGARVYEPGYRVPVVDTLGSGDAWSAGFVHTLLQGGSLAEACRMGNLLGAAVAARPGGTTPVSRAELDELSRAGSERCRHPGWKDLA